MITERTVLEFKSNQKSKQFLNYETEIITISVHNLTSTQNVATPKHVKIKLIQNCNAHNLNNKRRLHSRN